MEERTAEITEKIKKNSYDGFDLIQGAVMVIVIVILLFTFVARQSLVLGPSMEPTLYGGERLLVSSLFYSPQYGDIIVLRKESYSSRSIIKRVIATEGQTVDIDFDAGVVYVDGAALDEPYVLGPTYVREQFEEPVTVPEGCVFVLGDNRNDSTDSRWEAIGCVDKRCIIGRVLFRVLPLDRFGRV